MEQPNLIGSTGLLRTSYAGSGPVGSFRVGFLTDWFTQGGFLCRPTEIAYGGRNPMDKACSSNRLADSASRVGGTFVLNATPLPYLEGYAALRTYATTNDQGHPQLLQVLGDTTLGAKAFLPPKIGQVFTFGGEVQLTLLNGTGGVGIAGVSGLIRALGTADFRKPNDAGLPIRVNVNLGYKIDNSGALVAAVETQRGANEGLPTGRVQPITRIERFGLGINRVDFFQMYFGVEAPFARVQPYVEWSVDVPANRQGYQCHTSTVSRGDVCLGLDNFSLSADAAKVQGGPGFAAFPSRLTLGVKTNPLPNTFRGLSAHLALDIATSGSSTFVEEIAPEAPWMLYLGLGFAYDTRVKELPPPVQLPAPPAQIIQAPQSFIRGLVHEQGKPEVVVNEAIVTFEGGVQAPLATSPDGHFVTRHVEPGTYKLNIKAAGFKPGTCSATVVPVGVAQGPMPGAPAAPVVTPFGAPPAGISAGTGTPGAPPGAPGAPVGPAIPPAPAPNGMPAIPGGPTFVDIDCALEGLPRLGNVLGVVRDGEAGGPVAGAVIRMTDPSGKESSATADATGAFAFRDVAPGAVMLRGEATGFMGRISAAEVRASEDTRPTIHLTKRPKVASVSVQGREIRISKQIHFETDSAKIMGDSNALLDEIADVLQHSPNLKKVEIQGHTDNTGTREHNIQLSDARASSVKAWLVGAGVDASRLTAKGFGPDHPLSPNVTAANRAKNRRVQFIIVDGK